MASNHARVGLFTTLVVLQLFYDFPKLDNTTAHPRAARQG